MEKFNEIAGFENKNAVNADEITYIKSTSVLDNKELERLLSMYGTNSVGVDADAIDDDIKKLKSKADKTANRNYKNGAMEIINYLEKLKKSSSKEFKIKLVNVKRGITGIPIHLYRFTNFNIQSTDYVSVQDRTVASVKYDNILDAMALMICREDLDISIEDIEKGLCNLGMVSTYSSEKLKDFVQKLEGKKFTDGNIYNMCMSMRIDKSDYINLEKKAICDYFGEYTEIDEKDTYQTVLENSASKMMKLITFEILRCINNCGFGYRLISVNDGLITFTLDKSVDINRASSILNLSVVLKIFGRKFKFNPDIKISKISN